MTTRNILPIGSSKTPSALLQRASFRWRISEGVLQMYRQIQWRILGATIGEGNRIASTVSMNWPHQVVIESGCVFEERTALVYPFPWRPPCAPIKFGNRAFVGRGCEFNISEQITVGDDVLIASGCKFIDHDHSTDLGTPTNSQPSRSAPIRLEDDVWLGVNVVVLKGVTIGKGAVVGAGAVVTKSVPPYEIWAGIPARKIGARVAANDRISVE